MVVLALDPWLFVKTVKPELAFPSLMCSSFAEMFPCRVCQTVVFSVLAVTTWLLGKTENPRGAQRGFYPPRVEGLICAFPSS